MSEGSAGGGLPQGSTGLVVFVTGTGTEVGKTWVTAELARQLRGLGLAVAARKPVQSFDPDQAGPTDAEVLAAATGQRPEDVCSPECSYAMPLAPPMAACRLGRRCPTIEDLAAGCRFVEGTDVGFVEGVGGLYSPLAADGHNLDLIERLAPGLVIVVASADLGGIHDATAATVPLGTHPHAIFLNRFDSATEIHALNLDWLRRSGLQVAATVTELANIVPTPS